MAIALGGALLGASGAQAANLLANAGFESGVLAPWVQTNNFCFGTCADWAVTNADAHSGAFAAVDDGNIELTQTFAPVSGADVTEVSFWERHPTSAGLPSYVELFYSAGSATFEVAVTNTTDWQQFNVTNLVDPGRMLTGIGIYGYSGGADPNRTLLDDLVINSNGGVPEPATWAMMLLGFGALGGAMRQRRREAAVV
jgi:hypothetical protein